MFSFSVILENYGLLLWAARHTLSLSLLGMALSLSLLGMALGLIAGMAICAATLSPSAVISRLAAIYISFFRGVPLLVQLLLAYYLLPVVGINMPPLAAAVGTIGLCSAAYISEMLRGALLAIPKGQRESAEAIGMAPLDIWIRILIPQAVKISLPSLINELILLVKVSSLVSVVGIVELTRMSQSIVGSTFRPLEIYLAAASIYLVINLALAAFGRFLEEKLSV